MSLTKQQLLDLNNSSFPNNNAGAITAEDLRVYNSSSIAAFVDENTYLTESASFDARIDSLEAFSSSLDATFATDAQLAAVSSALNTSKVGNSQTSSMAVSSSTYALTASFVNAASKADTVYVGSDVGDALRYISFTQGAGYQQVSVDTIGGLKYNPATNTLVGNVISASSAISTSIINGLGNASEFSSSILSKINSVTASSLVTASFSSQSLTFTKGDGSQFSLTIPDISGSTIDTASFATTGSNTFNGNQIISGSEYISNGDLYLSTPGAGIKLYSSGSQSSQIQWYLGDQTSNRWLNIQRVPGGSQVAISDFPANNHFMFFQFSTGSVSQSIQFEAPIQSTGSSNLIINNGVTIAGVDFIPFSSSVDSRINTNTTNIASNSASIATNTANIATLTSKTGSYATTGSNTFVGNQTVTGVVSISSSATYDLDITGAWQATANSRVSSSLGNVLITPSSVNVTNLTSSFTTNLAKSSVNAVDSTGTPTTFKFIAISPNPSAIGAASLSGITVPSIVTPSGSSAAQAGFIAPIQFQHVGNYTDGRVTFTTPLYVSSSATTDLNVQGQLYITGGNYNSAGAAKFTLQGYNSNGTDLERTIIDGYQIYLYRSGSSGINSETILTSQGGFLINDNANNNYFSANATSLDLSDSNGTILGFTQNGGYYGLPNWTGSAIYQGDPINGPVAALGFQSATDWTDGRVTALYPVSVAKDQQLRLPSGSNQQTGLATLDGGNPGTVTVSNSLVTANSLIFLTKQTNTNSGAGVVSVTSKGTGTFSITSDHNGDTDVVAYMIINPS